MLHIRKRSRPFFVDFYYSLEVKAKTVSAHHRSIHTQINNSMKLILRHRTKHATELSMTFQSRLYKRLKRQTRRFIKRQRANGVMYPGGFCSVHPKRCVTRHKRLFRLWMKAIFAKKQKQKHIAEDSPNSEDEKDESEYEKEGCGEYQLNDGFLVSDESLEYVEHDSAAVSDENVVDSPRQKAAHTLYESGQDSGDSEWEE